jgi:CcmD family protein
MLGAYALVWLSVFGYAFRTNRLQRSVEANLERMERSIARQGTSAS